MFIVFSTLVALTFALDLSKSDTRMINLGEKQKISTRILNKYCSEYGTQYLSHTVDSNGLALDCKDSDGAIMPFIFAGSDLEDLRRQQWNSQCASVFGAKYEYAGVVEDQTGPRAVITLLCNKPTPLPADMKTDKEALKKMKDYVEHYKPSGVEK